MLKHHFGFLVAGAFLITAVVGEAKWYTAADGNDYIIDPDARYNWFDAMVKCASGGLSLVTSPSEERYMALRDVLRVVGNGKDFWIGGHYSSGDHQYYWATTGSPFDYTYWSQYNPSDNYQNQCVSVNAYGLNYVNIESVGPESKLFKLEANDYFWANNYCNNDYGLLCEKRPRSL